MVHVAMFEIDHQKDVHNYMVRLNFIKQYFF